MKIKEKLLAALLPALLIISNNCFSQNLSEDEKMRVKYSVHLVTYDTVSTFDNSQGEANFKLLLFTFSEEQFIPEIEFNLVSKNDQEIIQKHIDIFKAIKTNPPTWQELLRKESEYLKWIDASQRRKSKYNN